MLSGNNCHLPRSRPYVSILMEFPSVPRSNISNGTSHKHFWSSLASPYPVGPQSLVSEHNGFHQNGAVTTSNGQALMCALLKCVRVMMASARNLRSRGNRAPSRVYGISSDTLSSDHRFQDESSQSPRESPPYLPSEPRTGNGIGTVRDLPV